jgi:hypothetical protein
MYGNIFFSTLKSDERQNECTAAAFLIMTTGIASPLLNVKHFPPRIVQYSPQRTTTPAATVFD